MNILAVNGSPRPGWNTEMILEHALAGAALDPDAHVESVNLHPMKYSGCIVCYACKHGLNFLAA